MFTQLEVEASHCLTQSLSSDGPVAPVVMKGRSTTSANQPGTRLVQLSHVSSQHAVTALQQVNATVGALHNG